MENKTDAVTENNFNHVEAYTVWNNVFSRLTDGCPQMVQLICLQHFYMGSAIRITMYPIYPCSVLYYAHVLFRGSYPWPMYPARPCTPGISYYPSPRARWVIGSVADPDPHLFLVGWIRIRIRIGNTDPIWIQEGHNNPQKWSFELPDVRL